MSFSADSAAALKKQKQGSLRRMLAAHPNVTQFLVYFLVCNVATIIQVALIPVFQALLGGTELVDVGLHLFGPIGPVDAMTTVVVNGAEVTGLNPYYVFNYTAGPVNTLVETTLNGVQGRYLAHGGLAYFLSANVPLLISQVASFLMQRSVTFKSKGNIVKQGALYFLAFLIITIGSSALYGLYQPVLYSMLGEGIGGIVSALVQCAVAFWVFYPIMGIIFPKEASVSAT